MPLQEELSGSSMGPVPTQSLAEDLGQTLGPDWLQLRDTALGGEPIDLVLLHPRRGIALLQLAPRWTVDAPARLRHRLDQARFGAIFHGHLPVVHRLIQPGEAAALPRLLAEAFAGQPALDLPAGDAWLRVVHRALLNRPSAPPEALRPAARPAGRRSLQIAGGLGLAGLLAATALLARPGPAPEPQAVLAEAIAVATPIPVAAASPMSKTVEEPAVEAPMAETPASEVPASEVKLEPAALILTVANPGAPPAQAAPDSVTALPGDALDMPGDLPQPPPVPAPPTLLSLAATPPVPEVPPPPPVTAALATPNPILVAPPPPPRPLATRRPGQDLAALLRRGEALLALGDVSGARRFFERAAEAGDPAGAHAMGRTYDPTVLGGLQVRGIAPDQALAADWYRRAREMTSTDMTEMTR